MKSRVPLPDNEDMRSAATAQPLQLLDPPAPPPLPRASLSYPTTIILLPAIVAIGGALVIDLLHYDDGFFLMRRTPHWWRMLLHMLLFGCDAGALIMSPSDRTLRFDDE